MLLLLAFWRSGRQNYCKDARGQTLVRLLAAEPLGRLGRHSTSRGPEGMQTRTLHHNGEVPAVI